jgi:hypothetical protein
MVGVIEACEALAAGLFWRLGSSIR